jgi:hypothetical protein
VIALVKNGVVTVLDLPWQVKTIKKPHLVRGTNRIQERTMTALEQATVRAVCEKEMVFLKMAMPQKGLEELMVDNVSPHTMKSIPGRHVIIQRGPNSPLQSYPHSSI